MLDFKMKEKHPDSKPGCVGYRFSSFFPQFVNFFKKIARHKQLLLLSDFGTDELKRKNYVHLDHPFQKFDLHHITHQLPRLKHSSR